MNMKYVLWLLETLNQWDVMSGGVGTNIATIVFWSQVPRATAYRYLQKMIGLGYVKASIGTYRKQQTTMYNITETGKVYLRGSKKK